MKNQWQIQNFFDVAGRATPFRKTVGKWKNIQKMGQCEIFPHWTVDLLQWKETVKIACASYQERCVLLNRTVSYFESFSSRVPDERLPWARAHTRLCHASHIFEFLRCLCSKFQRKGIVWRHWILHTQYHGNEINIVRFWKKEEDIIIIKTSLRCR